jgi:hypothetical protein
VRREENKEVNDINYSDLQVRTRKEETRKSKSNTTTVTRQRREEPASLKVTQQRLLDKKSG